MTGEWTKSSESFSCGNCVEARELDGAVQVRDSKDPRPVLRFTPGQWQQFLGRLR